MKLVRPGLLLVWFLLGASLALGCEWDSLTHQGLDLMSSKPELGSPTEVTDAEECKTACCSKRGCDVALVGTPQDGALQCYLVRCLVLGSDQCQPTDNSQFQVHRKKQQLGDQTLVKPLLGGPEEKNQTDQSQTCRLPAKVGSCRASFPRFYYDVTNQSCQDFIYGGCESNGNNFNSKEECEAACAGVTGSVLPDDSKSAHDLIPRMAPRLSHGLVPEMTAVSSDTPRVMSAEDYAERCGAEPEVGPCRAALQHWYYDSEAGSCKRFIYGGCRGNQNNYVSEQTCMDTCTGVTVLPASKKVSVADDFEESCGRKPDPGPCRAAFPKFYYDPDTNTCQSFIYGGCRGNDNRHDSREECLNRCRSEVWANSGQARRHWTSGLFLFVTLTAVSALLLAALIIFTLKRRRFTSATSSVSDKQELLPEADQLSVDSLSLPESPKANQA